MNAIEATAPGETVILELEQAVWVPSLAPILIALVLSSFTAAKVATPDADRKSVV